MAFEDQILILSLIVLFFIRFCESLCSDGTYFDKLLFTKFEVGNVSQTLSVKVAIQCIWECSGLPECLSLNIADQPNQDGLFECILLRELAMPSSGLLVLSHIYHHYFRRFGQGMCASPRCKNGGTCVTLVNDFCCLCQERFIGKHCEINLACNTSSALGMEDGRIPDQQLSVSSIYSTWYLPSHARLNFKANSSYTRGAWAAKSNDVNQWFQIDLGTVAKVTGIATQGGPYHSEWVTSYSLQYRADNSTYVDYEQGKTFTGNSDKTTVVKNDVDPAIIARYIRVRPKTWRKHISMRIELYGCK